MATITSVTKYFPTAKEGFTTTLASTVSSGAATVPLNSVTGYTNGDVVCMTVDPGNASKQVFTGTVDTAGVQITGVVWTEGTNVQHTAGATVVDYVSATHMSIVSKGILQFATQAGALTNAAVRAALNLDAGTSTGWTVLGYTLNTVTYNGNHSYTCVFNGNDLTSTISAGMRLRFTRTVAASTQCTSLNGTTQYYSKSSPAGMTFTDDFTVSAWVKASSYSGSDQIIASRYNGTSGWALYLTATTGTLTLIGFNGGSSNISYVRSYQSVPLGRWVHVAAQLDMSAFTATTTTSYIMFDGIDVPASVGRGGTNPTALVQAGNLEIGSQNGGSQPFAGKIAQIAIYSAKVTQATVTASVNQTLSGSETSLISAYSFNNTINDLNTGNANNLTANGSAVATNADSPFGGQAGGTINSTLDYGIIHSVTFSTNTTVVVQVPEGNTIPTSGGVSAVSYAIGKTAYGFPTQRSKWSLLSIVNSTYSQNPAVDGTWYNVGSHNLNLPIGEWRCSYQSAPYSTASGGGVILYQTISSGSSSESNIEFTTEYYQANTIASAVPRYVQRPLSLSAMTVYYLNLKATGGGTMVIQNRESSPAIFEAENAYIQANDVGINMNQSDQTKIAVLITRMDDLKEDVKEVKQLVGDKIATKEYVDDRINPLKKLVYWMLGLLGLVLIALITVVVGLAVKQ